MMRKNRPRSSSLFLMELILAILFFSVASAVCVQIFVKSHLMSRQSEALNHAVTECTNAAELFFAASNPEDCSGSTYYDTDFALCEKATAAYVLTVDIRSEDSNTFHAHIAMQKYTDQAGTDLKDTDLKMVPLYELDTTHHIARRTGYEKK